VHVQLRELPLTAEDPQGEVKVELSVIDTGKVRCSVTILRATNCLLLGNKPRLLKGM
jgi:hypothetical protein